MAAKAGRRVPAFVYNKENRDGVSVTDEATLDKMLAEGWTENIWEIDKVTAAKVEKAAEKIVAEVKGKKKAKK